MSKWKITPPADIEREAATKAKFGDKSKCKPINYCNWIANAVTMMKLTNFPTTLINNFEELVVITGTSSGLGRKTAQALLRTGQYHVIGGVRDIDKMEAVAEIDGFDTTNFTPIQVELNSFDSVRKFCDEVKKFKLTKPIDRLVCNAGIYQPTLPYAKWSADGHEQTMQVNYLSHFLMVR
jgi:NADP-dependent 3-hydroxy acid dehydrogenase YdfG